MMRLPLPVIFAALVVVAAGSVLISIYFESDAPYVLNLTDVPYRHNKTVVLNYVPHEIYIVSNIDFAWYDLRLYVNGTYTAYYTDYEYVVYICHNWCVLGVSNDMSIRIEPVDVRDTSIKIVATRVWPP